jgi:hypothetical protein
MDDRTEGLEPRTREIRAEIERTREDMSDTIDAIQDKLRPGNIVAGASERVRNATTERMKQMTGEGRRENLIPAALIGVGAAWLLMNRSRDSNRFGDWNSGRTWRGAEQRGSDYYGAVGTAGAPEAYVGSEESSVRGLAGRAGERLSELGGETRSTVRRSTRRARNQLSRMIDENPLMVGAAAMVVGAAVGIALPETERENEWMGETRENVIDRAQDVARQAADRVKEKAGEAARTVTGLDQS